MKISNGDKVNLKNSRAVMVQRTTIGEVIETNDNDTSCVEFIDEEKGTNLKLTIPNNELYKVVQETKEPLSDEEYDICG